MFLLLFLLSVFSLLTDSIKDTYIIGCSISVFLIFGPDLIYVYKTCRANSSVVVIFLLLEGSKPYNDSCLPYRLFYGCIIYMACVCATHYLDHFDLTTFLVTFKKSMLKNLVYETINCMGKPIFITKNANVYIKMPNKMY